MLALEMGLAWDALEADGLADEGTGEFFEQLYMTWLTGWPLDVVREMGVQDAVLTVLAYERLTQMAARAGVRR